MRKPNRITEPRIGTRCRLLLQNRKSLHRSKIFTEFIIARRRTKSSASHQKIHRANVNRLLKMYIRVSLIDAGRKVYRGDINSLSRLCISTFWEPTIPRAFCASIGRFRGFLPERTRRRRAKLSRGERERVLRSARHICAPLSRSYMQPLFFGWPSVRPLMVTAIAMYTQARVSALSVKQYGHPARYRWPR